MIVKLGEVACECRNTWKESKEGVPVVGLEHLEPGEITLSAWDIDSENTFSKKFSAGQVLLGRRRVYLRKAVLAPMDGICSGDITVIEALPNKILPELLPFIIQNDAFFNYAMKGSAGSLSPRVKWEHLQDYEFELPPLSEQRVLADKLWAAYRLKESYKKLLKATDEMVKSQFIEMFENCRRTSFKDCVTISKTSINPQPGTMYTLYSFPAYDNHQEPEVTDGGEIKSSKVVLKENVVLYNKLNVRLSRVWNIEKLNTQNNICSSEFLPIKSKDNSIMTQQFIYQLLKSDYVTKKMVACSTGTSNSQKRITPSSLMDLEVPIPSIALQQQFVSIAEQADKSKFELNKSIEAIDQVIKSLINN